ncbi:MAG: C2 family cysteine protease [Bradymonadia bacterium]
MHQTHAAPLRLEPTTTHGAPQTDAAAGAVGAQLQAMELLGHMGPQHMEMSPVAQSAALQPMAQPTGPARAPTAKPIPTRHGSSSRGLEEELALDEDELPPEAPPEDGDVATAETQSDPDEAEAQEETPVEAEAIEEDAPPPEEEVISDAPNAHDGEAHTSEEEGDEEASPNHPPQAEGPTHTDAEHANTEHTDAGLADTEHTSAEQNPHPPEAGEHTDDVGPKDAQSNDPQSKDDTQTLDAPPELSAALQHPETTGAPSPLEQHGHAPALTPGAEHMLTPEQNMAVDPQLNLPASAPTLVAPAVMSPAVGQKMAGPLAGVSIPDNVVSEQVMRFIAPDLATTLDEASDRGAQGLSEQLDLVAQGATSAAHPIEAPAAATTPDLISEGAALLPTSDAATTLSPIVKQAQGLQESALDVFDGQASVDALVQRPADDSAPEGTPLVGALAALSEQLKPLTEAADSAFAEIKTSVTGHGQAAQSARDEVQSSIAQADTEMLHTPEIKRPALAASQLATPTQPPRKVALPSAPKIKSPGHARTASADTHTEATRSTGAEQTATPPVAAPQPVTMAAPTPKAMQLTPPLPRVAAQPAKAAAPVMVAPAAEVSAGETPAALDHNAVDLAVEPMAPAQLDDKTAPSPESAPQCEGCDAPAEAPDRGHTLTEQVPQFSHTPQPMSPLAPLEGGVAPVVAPPEALMGIPVIGEAFQQLGGDLHSQLTEGMSHVSEGVHTQLEGTRGDLDAQLGEAAEGARTTFGAQAEQLDDALHGRQVALTTALGEAECAVGCGANTQRARVGQQAGGRTAQAEAATESQVGEAHAQGEAELARITEEGKSGVAGARRHGKTVVTGVDAKAKTCSAETKARLGALATELTEHEAAELTRLDETRAQAIKDLDAKMESERQRMVDEAKAQEAALDAEIARRDSEIQGEITERKTRLDEHVKIEHGFLEQSAKTEKEDLNKQLAKQIAAIDKETTAQDKALEAEGIKQAKAVTTEAQTQGKKAIAMGEKKAKEAIAAANARASGLSDATEASKVRSLGFDRASTARNRARSRVRSLERRAKVQSSVIAFQTKMNRAGLVVSAKQKKTTLQETHKASVKAIDQQLAHGKKAVQKQADDGLKAIEADRKQMLAALAQHKQDTLAKINQTIQDGEAEISKVRDAALQKIETAHQKAAEQIKKKTADALAKLEAGCDRDLTRLERMAERTKKQVTAQITTAEAKMKGHIQVAARRAKQKINLKVNAIKAQGRKAVKAVKTFSDAALKAIDASATAAHMAIGKTGTEEETKILQAGNMLEQSLKLLGDTYMINLKSDHKARLKGLKDSGKAARKGLIKHRQALRKDIDQEWADDARRAAEKLLDDNGVANVVTDGEATEAALIMTSLPAKAKKTAFKEMDDDRFQNLLDELPSDRKMDLYAHMSGTEVSGHIAHNFAKWAGEDGYLSAKEISALMADPNITGEDAAALATLRSKLQGASKLNNDEWGDETTGMTLDDFAHVAKTKDLDYGYTSGLDSIKEKKSQGLFTDPKRQVDWQKMKQKKIGDCYWLAALNTQIKRDPDFPNKAIQENKDGSYTVTLPNRGTVTVEPLTEAEMATTGNADGNWLAVMEKAYAKSRSSEHDDEYQAIHGDPIELGIKDATGNEANVDKMKDVKPTDTAKKMEDAFKNGKVVTASISKSNKYNLPDGHAYTVMGYDPVKKTVQLRNPWGHGEGSTGDGKNDGVFTLTLEEYHDIVSRTAYED